MSDENILSVYGVGSELVRDPLVVKELKREMEPPLQAWSRTSAMSCLSMANCMIF